MERIYATYIINNGLVALKWLSNIIAIKCKNIKIY